MDHNDKKKKHEQGSEHKDESTTKTMDEQSLEQDQDPKKKEHDEEADKIGNF